VSGLYAPEELMSVRDYLTGIYGARVPADEEESIKWKLSEIEMYHKSAMFAMSNYYRVPNKDGDLVPLRPFAGQAILDICIEAHRRVGEPQRTIGFKSRQVGWSTWMLGRTLHHTSSAQNKRGMFLVPDEDVANVMSTRMASMLNGVPRFLQPLRRIQNMKHIVFDNPNPKERIDNPGLNSELQITVPSPMRGIPPSHLTISEYSHMLPQDQFNVTSSILPAMPLSANSLVVIDTTPNGFDDFYEPLVREAVDLNPKWVKRLEQANRSYTAEEILAGAIGQPENLYDGWLIAFERWDWHEEYCHVAGTLVDTPHGIVSIESVRVGDLTRFGKVTDTFIFKNKPVYKLLTNNGRKMVCTGTHPIMTPNGWVRADQMLGKRAKLCGPEFAEIICTLGDIAVTPDLARWLGYFMSDGAVTSVSGVSIACTGTDQDVADDVVALSESIAKNFPSLRTKPVKSTRRKGCLYVNFQRKGMYEFFEQHGMAKDGKRRVSVPDAILRSPKHVVREFLRSLFEGDGFCPKNRKHGVALGSKYRELLDHVQLLLLGFGITARIYQNNRLQKGTHCEGWMLYLRVSESIKFIECIGFVSERKNDRAKQYPNGHWTRHDQRVEEDGFEDVVSVEPFGFADVYDFTIAESHAFVANGIVVHNSVKSRENPRGELRKPPPKVWANFLATFGKDERFGGDEEIEQHEKFGVHKEKLYWRRRKITSYKMPNDEMRLATFRQEFARSIEGGFIELSKTPFDRASLDALMRQRKDPIATGLMDKNDEGQIGIRRSLGTDWHQVRIYAPPEVGQQYVMSVDTNNAYESADADKTACVIMRASDCKLVAIYVASVPEHILRQQVMMLHRWYFNAYCAIELKEMGYQLIRSLLDMGMTNYYSWKRMDADMPEPTKYPGWQTDLRTRPLMDNTFIEHLCYRDPDSHKAIPQMDIPDEQALKEIQGLRRGDSGSLKHQHGKDDIFDAICICLCLFRDPYSGIQRAREGPPPEQKGEFESLFRSASSNGMFGRPPPSMANL
jgi:hypothetical protein